VWLIPSVECHNGGRYSSLPLDESATTRSCLNINVYLLVSVNFDVQQHLMKIPPTVGAYLLVSVNFDVQQHLMKICLNIFMWCRASLDTLSQDKNHKHTHDYIDDDATGHGHIFMWSSRWPAAVFYTLFCEPTRERPENTMFIWNPTMEQHNAK
jgi:hypothetical protein